MNKALQKCTYNSSDVFAIKSFAKDGYYKDIDDQRNAQSSTSLDEEVEIRDGDLLFKKWI